MTPRVRVVTFNAFHDYPFFRHLDRRLALLEGELAREAPDVAVLQEMSVSVANGDLPRRLRDRLLARGLAYDLHYAPANGSVANGGDFEEGSAILSRLQILDASSHELAPESEVRRDFRGAHYVERRIAVRATLGLGGGDTLDVFGAHLTDAAPASGVSPRGLQLEHLARLVRGRPPGALPAIVAGDFNAPPESDDLARFRGLGFRDVCEGSDPGPTNDATDRDLERREETANQRIDFVFVAGDGLRAGRVVPFLAEAREVEPGRFLWASDHNGILADLLP